MSAKENLERLLKQYKSGQYVAICETLDELASMQNVIDAVGEWREKNPGDYPIESPTGKLGRAYDEYEKGVK